MLELPFMMPYDKITRGKIYLVGFPFDDGRPLTFVEKDERGEYKLHVKDYGFEPAIDEEGKKYSPEVSVVIPHKAKLAVVLQNDNDNHNPDWHYTFVAPIDSVGPQERAKSIVRRAIAKNDVDRIHYITCTGIDAIVEITKVRRCHKNLIFRSTKWRVPEEDLEQIMFKLASVLNIEKIPACVDCEMNCENCQWKVMASSQ